jgi:hypothetical protein
MFVVDCPACGQHELRSLHAVTGLSNTSRGIELALTCSNCGAPLRVVTGRQVGGRPVTLAAAPNGTRHGGPTAGPANRPAA